MKPAIVCSLSFVSLLSGLAQSQPSISPPPLAYEAQRARIEAERGQAQSQFDAAAVLCYQKFAVNDCLQAARTVRRDLLAELRLQSLAVRDAQARQKAADRLQGR